MAAVSDDMIAVRCDGNGQLLGWAGPVARVLWSFQLAVYVRNPVEQTQRVRGVQWHC